MVLAPEHGLLPSLTSTAQRADVEAYVAAAAAKSDRERTELQKDKSGVSTGATPETANADPHPFSAFNIGMYGRA